MAQKVQDNEIKFGNGSGSKYDWDAWFDGGTWVLKRGEDFDTEVDTFQTTVLIRARKRKVKVTTKKLGENKIAIKKVGARPAQAKKEETKDKATAGAPAASTAGDEVKAS